MRACPLPGPPPQGEGARFGLLQASAGPAGAALVEAPEAGVAGGGHDGAVVVVGGRAVNLLVFLGGDFAGRAVLGHDVDVGVGGEFLGEEAHDVGALVGVAGHDEVADEEAAFGEPFFVHLEGADLAVHLAHDLAGGGGVVFGFEVAEGEVVVPEFEVGHVDVDDAVEEVEAVEGVVGGGVVDDGQAQAALDGDGEGFEELGHDVFGGDEVDVMAAAVLQGEHHLGEAFGRGFVAGRFLANVEVLAEDAAEVAPGEEDGAAAVPAAEAVFFAEVGEVAGDAGVAAGFADGFTGAAGFDAVDAAVAGADGAFAEPLDGFVGAALEFAAAVEGHVGGFEVADGDGKGVAGGGWGGVSRPFVVGFSYIHCFHRFVVLSLNLSISRYTSRRPNVAAGNLPEAR